MTRLTFEFLQEERSRLRQRIIEQTKELRHAIESGGGTHDNAMYDSAMDAQAILLEQERRVSKYLEDPLIIEDLTSAPYDVVSLGHKVTIEEVTTNTEKTFWLVAPADIEFRNEKQMVSCAAPLGRILLGRCVGDEVEVMLPGGPRRYEIISLS